MAQQQPKQLKVFGTVRGRGAAANPVNRFELVEIDLDGDWVDEAIRDAELEGEVWNRAGRTRYYRDHTRGIIASNDSPDVGFERSVNPYRGCEHGCFSCSVRRTRSIRFPHLATSYAVGSYRATQGRVTPNNCHSFGPAK